MKKTLTTVLIGLALLATATAQEITNTVSKRFVEFAQGASTFKSLTFAVYPSYAPELVTGGKKDLFGFGATALYPLGNFAYTGLRVDYLGHEFWAPSINIGLKADVQIFGVNVTPMTYTGAIVPLSGAGNQNREVGYIIGGGASVSIWKGKAFGKDASFALAAAAEKWSNFPGNVYHIAPVFTISW
jgi:hypothetical protein